MSTGPGWRRAIPARIGCGFFLLNPRAVFTQATSSHAEARSPRFVRVLAAGFASLRAFLSKAALSSAHFRPASLDLGLAFRWPISRARRQMRGDRIKCLSLRTYRASCINATDSICRRARMESQSVVKLCQWARVDDKSRRSHSSVCRRHLRENSSWVQQEKPHPR